MRVAHEIDIFEELYDEWKHIYIRAPVESTLSYKHTAKITHWILWCFSFCWSTHTVSCWSRYCWGVLQWMEAHLLQGIYCNHWILWCFLFFFRSAHTMSSWSRYLGGVLRWMEAHVLQGIYCYNREGEEDSRGSRTYRDGNWICHIKHTWGIPREEYTSKGATS